MVNGNIKKRGTFSLTFAHIDYFGFYQSKPQTPPNMQKLLKRHFPNYSRVPN